MSFVLRQLRIIPIQDPSSPHLLDIAPRSRIAISPAASFVGARLGDIGLYFLYCSEAWGYAMHRRLRQGRSLSGSIWLSKALRRLFQPTNSPGFTARWARLFRTLRLSCIWDTRIGRKGGIPKYLFRLEFIVTASCGQSGRPPEPTVKTQYSPKRY